MIKPPARVVFNKIISRPKRRNRGRLAAALGKLAPAFATHELVTPEKAREFMRLSKNRRPVQPHSVSEYASIMQAGKWEDTGMQPVVFDKHGALINGQHRMLAIIRSGVAVRLHIIRWQKNEDRISSYLCR
ncbi:MAG TPA: hypothetical protein VMD75_17165 [Candidatus Binataceae bacterium]|nr:hypothetical protein [Candidatus Binataceae bacterium]